MKNENKSKKKREDFKTYCCYSNRQKEYLMDRGFEYVMIARDVNSLDQFWLFLRSLEFNKALDEYDKYRKSFNKIV